MNPIERVTEDDDYFFNERIYLAGALRDKDLLQFYLERERRENAWTSIALAGNLPFLRFLHLEGFPWNEDTCRAAAEGGHLEMLKWLRSEDCPWDDGTSQAAAERGDLEMLKWLCSEGCPWDKEACEAAAREGHLEVLKWLRSEGCSYSWTPGSVDVAS